MLSLFIPPAQREAWLRPVRTAETIEALEAALQACCHTPEGHMILWSGPTDRALCAAVEQRGWELVALDPLGESIPRIVRKPSSFRGTTYRGQHFPCGTWGNGAGYRWEKAGLVAWVERLGAFTDPGLARDLVDWVLSGMPHRALQRLQEGTP